MRSRSDDRPPFLRALLSRLRPDTVRRRLFSTTLACLSSSWPSASVLACAPRGASSHGQRKPAVGNSYALVFSKAASTASVILLSPAYVPSSGLSLHYYHLQYSSYVAFVDVRVLSPSGRCVPPCSSLCAFFFGAMRFLNVILFEPSPSTVLSVFYFSTSLHQRCLNNQQIEQPNACRESRSLSTSTPFQAANLAARPARHSALLAPDQHSPVSRGLSYHSSTLASRARPAHPSSPGSPSPSAFLAYSSRDAPQRRYALISTASFILPSPVRLSDSPPIPSVGSSRMWYRFR
ncbi:hypothetical protein A0H81_12423 [Grifola frondosa]|uniref:Uncharacterized protein n=1 Tax=Grifola frondosa TaxID=5627 RepID=A0A1C7LUF5_GRIFR|nr:hypothetical protein A0H81_12423 [Grifola frondosa]